MKRFVRVAIAIAAALLAAAPATAGDYPIDAPGAALSDARVSCGGAVTVSGSGWSQPSVSLSIFSTPVSLGTAAVNADGEFATEVVIPFGVGAGPHTIRVSGIDINGEPATVDLALTVPTCVLGEGRGIPGGGDGGDEEGGLALTGGNIVVGLVIFVALLVVGSSALIAGRRRARVRA